MLEVLNQDYIRTARSKGLTERTTIMRHAFRNGLLPLASIVPVDIITLVGGAVITERVFNYHGLGNLSLQAAQSFDLPTLIGMVVFAGSIFILANLIVDILYSFIDPRVRVS